MSEERYNNRQIEKMLTDQSADIKEHIDLKVSPLLEQVKKTNGRVSWNEKMIYLAMGSLFIVLPMLTYVLVDYWRFKERFPEAVSDAVREGLDTYQFEVINPIIEK